MNQGSKEGKRQISLELREKKKANEPGLQSGKGWMNLEFHEGKSTDKLRRKTRKRKRTEYEE